MSLPSRCRHDYYQDKKIRSLDRRIKDIKAKEELKYLDTYEQFASMPGVATLRCLNLLATGDTQALREGSQVYITSVQWRINFKSLMLSVEPLSPLRMIIFWDQQCNGTSPDITGPPIGSGSSALLNSEICPEPILMPYQHENSDRFKILHDEYISLKPQTSDNTPATVQLINTFTMRHAKVRTGRISTYDGTTATVAAIARNALWVVFLATADDYSKYGLDMSFRIYFKDD